MGGFVSICAMMIMCYYAVVTGWTFRYVIFAVSGDLNGIESSQALELFDQFRASPGPWFFFVLALGVSGWIVHSGAKGIERMNKILIPTLVIVLIIGAVSALSLPNAGDGIRYLFHIEPERFGSPGHWIAGLTQSAWSTGAGWGLMLAYAVYAREEDDAVTTPMATGAGNNSIELIVGLLIFPAVFSILGSGAESYVAGTRSTGGISFETVPMLFAQMKAGNILTILFFLGLASAALTSLVAMVELSVRFFSDFGLSRGKAIGATIAMSLLIGSPAALSDSYFSNQDYVWGVGLILSGLFLSILVLKFGPHKFVRQILNPHAGPLFIKLFSGLMILVCLEAVILLGWWLHTMSSDRNTLILCLVQWGIVIVGLILLRGRLSRSMDSNLK